MSTIKGDAGNNALAGGTADDIIDGGGGADIMQGGDGNDTYYVDNIGDQVIEKSGEGTDTVISSISLTTAFAYVEKYTFNTSLAVTFTGNSATNTVKGGSGNDTLSAGASGFVQLYGNAGNDTLTGGTGGDLLDGGTGADIMTGGAGNDTYYIDNVGDQVIEQAGGGLDTIFSSVSISKLADNVETGSLTGGANLNLTGNDLANSLHGNTGNNIIDGGAGADIMAGWLGNDTYYVDNTGDQVVEEAGAGTDQVISSVTFTLSAYVENLTLTGSGNINGTGNSENNIITGNAGDNILNGDTGSDTLIGGGGNDFYYVDNAGDKVVEGVNGGTDIILSAVSYVLPANVEYLELAGSADINGTGGNAADTIYGNSGNNVLDGKAGADTLAGGTGNDTYYVDNAGDNIVENAGEGTDTVISSILLTNVFANVENYTFNTGQAVNFTGDGNNNTIIGGSGNDTINGAGGDDTLNGGIGADKMTGSTGNDTYYVDNAGDLVIENANEGADNVDATITITKLWNNVENAMLLGNANLNLTGNDLANTLSGNAGSNVIDGGAGADDMIGGKGNDTYVVDDVNDVVVENANEGTDLVKSSVSYTLSANVENLTLTGSGNISGIGNNDNNTITGNAGDNTISGNGGSDTLIGGGGNDTYYVDNVGDKVVEGVNGGTDVVLTAVSYVLPANVEYLELAGSADINGTGGGGADTIYGNSGNNVLDGKAGADFMAGGAGNDTYYVDNAGDQVFENTGEGTDTVISSILLTNVIANVENYTFKTGQAVNFTGDGNNNTIIGGSGNDTLNGSGGDDQLNGGIGADKMIGGTGNDLYYVDNAGDQVIENPNEGVDSIIASVTIGKLADNVEWAQLTGNANLNLTGNALDNILTGNAGNNVIDGGTGNDTMFGLGGNDTYYVDSLTDAVNEAANQGTDTVISSVTFTLNPNIENLTLTGNGNISGTGNSENNIITGNAGDNILDGGAGNDTLIGGGGDDFYDVDSAGDKVVEAANGGLDQVDSSVSYVLPVNVEYLQLLGSGDINGTGNAAANFLSGNSGNNVLDGKAGADIMTGLAGNDTYYVDNVGDQVNEVSGEGTDTVISTVALNTGFANVENYVFNTSQSVTFTGDAGDNSITGGSGNDTIIGGGGNDKLTGGAGNDTLTTGSGNDQLDGGLGADKMTGGAGNDIYYVDNAGDQVIEQMGGGSDLIYASISIGKLADNVETGILTGSANLNLTGNALANTLVGNSGSNVIDGGAGGDIMAGGKGNDTYYVDSASDQVFENANEGTDAVISSVDFTLGSDIENLTLTGSAVNGTGNAQKNVITGDAADNVLDGGAGDDVMAGGLGSDLYYVDSVGDKVIEAVNAGISDTIVSSVSYSLANAANVENLTLSGTGNINATGSAIANILDGNSGDNIIDGGTGADFMQGGAGNDTYHVDNIGDTVAENAGEGIDTVISTVVFNTAIANVENYTFNTAMAVNFTGDSGNNIITGGAGNDSITGGGGNDNLYGGAGNDTLTASSGSDLLDGGTGADKMTGGAGNDIYYVDNAGDQVIEQAGGGTDMVYASIAISKLWDNVETAILTGTANLNLTGNTADNLLAGNAGNNIIDGGAGADTMFGFGGNDTYYVDNANDVVNESANQGTDLVISSVDFSLGANVENLTLTGTANIDGTGNGDDNVITGNAGNNILNGNTGNDTLIGGLGDDTYYVDSVGDKVVEAVNGGTDTVNSYGTYILSANVETLNLLTTSDINGTGNALNNTLNGNAGNNILDGKAGADIMTGGAGNDTYYIDNVGDQVIEALNGGTDTVNSAIVLSGVIANVENYFFTTSAAVNFIGDAGNNVITGGSGNDTIHGGGGNDDLGGGAGNDILIAGSGADYLSGGAGADKMTGGAGDDTYVVDNAGDQVIELVGGGTDMVWTTTSISKLWDNVENVSMSGPGNFNVTGNDLDNVIKDNGSNNVLDGGAGDDTLYSLAGSDTLTGGLGNDSFVFSMAPWQVAYHTTITDFNKSQDSLVFGGIGDRNSDGMVDITDLNQAIASIVDGGIGKNVDVTLTDGEKFTFLGVGTGAVTSISSLVANPNTQISVS